MDIELVLLIFIVINFIGAKKKIFVYMIFKCNT